MKTLTVQPKGLNGIIVPVAKFCSNFVYFLIYFPLQTMLIRYLNKLGIILYNPERHNTPIHNFALSLIIVI